MSFIEAAIGWLAPPLCLTCGDEGAVLCELCVAAEILPYGARCWNCGSMSERARTCPKCRTGSPRFVWISTDYLATSRQLLSAYKFGHLRAAAPLLADLMVDTYWGFNDEETAKKNDYLIVPIPTASSRRRERGFDHAGLLAKYISNKLGLDKANILGRIGQKRQVGAHRSERWLQAENSYFIKNDSGLKGRNLLLVDDVVTTGATLKAATKLLRQAGAGHVDALVFAKKL